MCRVGYNKSVLWKSTISIIISYTNQYTKKSEYNKLGDAIC